MVEKECVFKRIKIADDFDISNAIMELKEFLLAAIKSKKDLGTFAEWEIKNYELDILKTQYPNAVMFKTNATEFDASYIPFSGPLKINDYAREHANLFIAFSGATVVFVSEISPGSWKETSRGYYQTGKILPNHSLLSSGVTKWTSTSNKTYGKNLNKKK